jgi:hypothetical protein
VCLKIVSQAPLGWSVLGPGPLKLQPQNLSNPEPCTNPVHVLLRQVCCEEVLEEVGFSLQPHQLLPVSSVVSSAGITGSAQAMFFAQVCVDRVNATLKPEEQVQADTQGQGGVAGKVGRWQHVTYGLVGWGVLHVSNDWKTCDSCLSFIKPLHLFHRLSSCPACITLVFSWWLVPGLLYTTARCIFCCVGGRCQLACMMHTCMYACTCRCVWHCGRVPQVAPCLLHVYCMQDSAAMHPGGTIGCSMF